MVQYNGRVCKNNLPKCWHGLYKPCILLFLLGTTTYMISKWKYLKTWHWWSDKGKCKRAFFRVSSRRIITLSIHRGLFQYKSNGGIIHNTHTITRLPQRIRLYSIVSWQRLPAHTHQASLVPHIRSHLHNPSSRIHIFAELHVGSLWLVGTPWHTFVYPSLDK